MCLTIAAARAVACDVGGEAAVELELVGRQVPQVGQRAVAGAVVVDRRPDAEAAQLAEHGAAALGIGHEGVLDQLQRQRRGRAGRARASAAATLPGRSRSVTLAADRFTDTGTRGRGHQRAAAVERQLEHRVGQRAQQAGLLGGGQQLGGGEQAAGRVLPADQRLGARRRRPSTRSTCGCRCTSSSSRRRAPSGAPPSCAAGRRCRRAGRARTRARPRGRPWPRTWRRRRSAAAPATVAAGTGAVATPMLTPTCSRMPSTVNGCRSSSRSRSAQRLRLVQAGVGQQDGELVAAQPGEEVAGPQGRAQARADLPEQVVAGVVAEAVVDLLEAVEVEQQQRGRARRAVAVVEHPLGLLEQRAPVGQPGQLVGAGLLPDLVEGADLAEGDGGAGEGGQHAADGQPRGHDRQLVAPADGEDDQAGDVAGQRQREEPPARRGSARRGRGTRRPVAAGAVRGERGQRDARSARSGRAGRRRRRCRATVRANRTTSPTSTSSSAATSRSSVRSRRTPRIAPTATSRASSRTSIAGRARLTSGDRARPGAGSRYGPSRKATPSAVVPERADDAVQPHARVEARHPGADQRRPGDVERQVATEAEQVDDRRVRAAAGRARRPACVRRCRPRSAAGRR